jgi:hypothetical protein
MPPYDESAISKAELLDLLVFLQSLHPSNAQSGELASTCGISRPAQALTPQQ